MNQKLITVTDLNIAFSIGDKIKPAVSGVSFSIERGETFALLGESGCGKSLTSLAMMQLLPPAAKIYGEGQIVLEGQNVLRLSEVNMRQIRGKRIAMIFQEPMTSLNPVMTVGDQILEVLKKQMHLRGLKAKKRVIELFDAVGLPDPEMQIKRYPHQLSGGMKQRVMIAMAIACEPDLLIADEPTSALDVTIQKQILTLLKALQKRTGMALLLITHDLGVVSQMADRVAVMYAGHLVEEGRAKDFFNHPLHPYSQKLFESVPDLKNRDHALAVIPGIVPRLTQDFLGCRFASRCQFAWEDCRKIDPKWLSKKNDVCVRCHLYDVSIKKRSPTLSSEQADKNSEIDYSKSHKPIFDPNTNVDASGENNGENNNLENIILELKDIKIHFPIQKGLFRRTVGWIKAVDGLSLELKRGKTVAIVGESGSGKTTLAKGILQLYPLTKGEIYFNGQIESQKQNHHAFREKCKQRQIIFQDPFSSMNPRMMVGDIIAEGLRALKIGNRSAQDKKIDQLIQQVGLPLDSKHRYPHEFSGGQRQRISIARALAVEPELLICDEPTSALDVSVQAQILNLLKELQQKKKLSYLLITHNIAVVAYMADVIAVMYQGKIVEVGNVNQILESPKHPYTKELLAAVLALPNNVT